MYASWPHRIRVSVAAIALCCGPPHAVGNPLAGRVDPAASIFAAATLADSNITRFLSPGLGFKPIRWRDADRESLDANFAIAAPFLIAAQRPPWAPQASLQQEFRVRASATQRIAMAAALKEWFDDPPWDPAPPGARSDPGSIRTAVVGDIERHRRVPWMRVLAAEQLSELEVPGTIQTIQAFYSQMRRLGLLDAHSLDALNLSIQRCIAPQAADFVRIGATGRIECGTTPPVDSIIVSTAAGGSRIAEPTRFAQQAQVFLRAARRAPAWVPHSDPGGWADVHCNGRVIRIERRTSRIVAVRDGQRADSAALEFDCPALASLLDMNLRAAGLWVAPKRVRFDSENVTLQLSKRWLHVRAWYRIEAGAKAEPYPITYPVLIDAGQAAPDSFQAWIQAGGRRHEAATRWENGGVRIVLPFDSSSTCALEVKYRQPLAGTTARYLLRSTWSWGEPIQRARIFCDVDPDWGEPVFNIPMEATGRRRGQMRSFRATLPDLWPAEDFVVRTSIGLRNPAP